MHIDGAAGDHSCIVVWLWDAQHEALELGPLQGSQQVAAKTVALPVNAIAGSLNDTNMEVLLLIGQCSTCEQGCAVWDYAETALLEKSGSCVLAHLVRQWSVTCKRLQMDAYATRGVAFTGQVSHAGNVLAACTPTFCPHQNWKWVCMSS